MNNTDTASNSWERIQSGVRETERLLGQKKYNMAMVKARQTLEYMVKCLCEQNGIMESGLVDMIDTLYEEGIINKTTCEHYHKIRTIGNKAIHEDSNTAYDANQAHHLLSQEVYTFANDYGSKRKKTASRSTASRSTSSRASSARPSSSRTASGRSSQSERSSSRSSSSSKSRRKESKPTPIGPQDIIKILIPIAIIVLLIFIIRMVTPSKKEVPETTETPSITATMEEDLETTSVPESATSESTTAAPTVSYKTTTTLNVRNKPSTTDSTVLAKLAPDTAVKFIRDENEEWAVIDYNGQEAYVSKEYLKEVTE